MLLINVIERLDVRLFADLWLAEDYRDYLRQRYEQVLLRYYPTAEIEIEVLLDDEGRNGVQVVAEADDEYLEQASKSLYEIGQYARELVLISHHDAAHQFQRRLAA